tara:strand:+ start:2523 stop:2702 length:180 start_codon:yes stop_codon:yes gene_type:complete
MFYFNKKGKLDFIDNQKINSDKEFYKKLWDNKYGIKLKTKNYGHTNKLISYIRNEKNFV